MSFNCIVQTILNRNQIEITLAWTPHLQRISFKISLQISFHLFYHVLHKERTVWIRCFTNPYLLIFTKCLTLLFTGRILNRFSKDIGALDELLPRFLLECIQIYLVMFSILALNAAALVWTLLPTTIILLLFYTILQIYLKSAQSIKRLEGTSKYTELMTSFLTTYFA